MSRRALRRLRGEQRGQEPLGPGALQFGFCDDDDAEEDGPKRGPGGRRPRGAGKEGVRVNNRFELINIEDLEEGPVVNGERSDSLLTDAVVSGSKRRSQSGSAEPKKDGEMADRTVALEQSNASGKLRKKKKKQKNKRNSTGETSENGLEDIDRILERIEDSSGPHRPGPPPLSSRKHVLYVEHRHLNPDTELKRYFGARAVLGEQRPRQRQRVYPKCTWLTTPKSTWPRYTKPGEGLRRCGGCAVAVAGHHWGPFGPGQSSVSAKPCAGVSLSAWCGARERHSVLGYRYHPPTPTACLLDHVLMQLFFYLLAFSCGYWEAVKFIFKV